MCACKFSLGRRTGQFSFVHETTLRGQDARWSFLSKRNKTLKKRKYPSVILLLMSPLLTILKLRHNIVNVAVDR